MLLNTFLAKRFNSITNNWLERRFLQQPYYPVPGFIGDPSNNRFKFKKWYARPVKSHKIYWRTHPKDHQRICIKNW